MTHRLAMPASSASWAIRAKVGPMLAGAPGQVKSATCSPIFMCQRYVGESTLPSLPQRGGEGPRTGCQMGTSPDIRSVDALGTGCPQAVFHPAIDRPLLAAGCAFLSGDGSVYGNGARGDLKPVASPAAPPSATDHRSRDGPPEGTLPGCSSCAEPDCPPRSPDAGTTCRRSITKPCTY